MRKLTKIIAPVLIAATALGVTGTASAQNYGGQQHQTYGNHNNNMHGDMRTPARSQAIRNQINELQRRIDRRDWRGRVSDREARGLRNDIGRLQIQFRTYNRDGLNGQEMRYLQTRIANIRTRLHIETRDWDNRAW